MKRLFLMILTLGLFATTAYAHNGMIHVTGTVTSVSGTSLSVKGADGKIQTMAFNSTTKFLRGETAVGARDIKVGDRTVVHATKKGDQLLAAEVRLGAAKMTGMSGSISGMKMNHPTPKTSQ